MIRIYFKAAFRLVSDDESTKETRKLRANEYSVKVDIITEKSENLKIFDVTIDSRLNFNEHIK